MVSTELDKLYVFKLVLDQDFGNKQKEGRSGHYSERRFEKSAPMSFEIFFLNGC